MEMEMEMNNSCLFLLLPIEITAEILSGLPVDSVSQCKLVCKTWRDLLIADHHHNNNNNSIDGGFLLRLEYDDDSGFYYGEYDEKVTLTYFNLTKKIIFNQQSLIENAPKYRYCTVGSCNGLICLSAYFDTYVYNPYTQEYAKLPTPNHDPRLRNDGPDDTKAYGFGYHPITEEYKVIRIYQYCRPLTSMLVQVYTLGSGSSNSWRSIGEIKHKFCKNLSDGYEINASKNNSWGIHINGALYWFTKKKKKKLVLSFDLADEEFRDIPLPRQEHSKFSVLGVLSGCLCVSTNVGVSAHLWVMNMKDYSWSKKFDISRMDKYGYFNIYPLAQLKSGKFLLHRDFNDFFSYDPETGHIVKIKSRMRGWPFDIIPYTRSSVSLKALGEKEAIQVKAEEENNRKKRNSRPLMGMEEEEEDWRSRWQRKEISCWFDSFDRLCYNSLHIY